VAAWCPNLGWIEADPTNDMIPGDRHIVLAWGRDYDDVSPVKGVTLGGGSHGVEVFVSVKRVENGSA
jgi:transglutaminase-like putative cysteine protease